MGKSSGKMQISEFRMSLQYGVVSGPVAEVTGLYLDKKPMWEGTLTESTAVVINQPKLFGGKKKEGGPVGTAFVMFGEDDQVMPTNLASKFGPGQTSTNTPANRGLLSVFFTGTESSKSPPSGGLLAAALWAAQKVGGGFLWANNNPYLKPISVRAFTKAQCDLEPELGVISTVVDGYTIRAINPAHILYDIYTNILGHPTVNMGDSWSAVAQTLYDEAFGLRIRWSRQGPVRDVVDDILDTIKGFIYEDLSTGLTEIRLARADYDPETLVEINPDNAKISNFQRRGDGERVNQLVGSWVNPANEEPSSITIQDIVSVSNSEGEVVSEPRDYHSVPTADLCSKLLARDLAEAVAPLASCTAEVSRSLWSDVTLGNVVKLTWPLDGIEQTFYMRIMKVDFPKKGQSGIKLTLMEDIFSLSRPDYGAPVTQWTDPSEAPDPVTDYQLFTLPALMAGQMQLLSAADYPEVGLGVLVSPPTSDTQNVELYSYDTPATGDAGWTDHGWRSLSGRIELSTPLVAEAETELSEFPAQDALLEPKPNGYLFIGDGLDEDIEIALIVGLNEDEDAWIIRRGVLDTVPRDWPSGTPVWFVDPTARVADDVTVRSSGETVRLKLLDKTSLGSYALADADEINFDLTDRPYLPLRPANVKVNGVSFGDINAAAATNISVTWSNRNRLLETTQVLGWSDGNVTPEYRQRTIVTIRNVADDTIIMQWLGLWTETSLTFPKSNLDRYSQVWVEVASERDGLESLQFHRIKLTGLPNNPTGAVAPSTPAPAEPPAPSPAPADGAFALTGSYTAGANGTRVPTLLLSGTSDDETATDVVFEYKRAADSDWSRTTAAIPEGGAVRLEIGGVAPLTLYNGRVGYITPLGLGGWLALTNVTTGALVAGDTATVGGVDAGDIVGGLADNANEIAEAAEASMLDMLNRVEQRTFDIRQELLGRLPAKVELARRIVVETEARAQALLDEAAARTSAIAAEATARATAILAEATARGAAITVEETARQTADDSLAASVTTLTASLASETGTLAAAIAAETSARATAIGAETTARETLAVQLRGSYTGSDLDSVSTGLLAAERNARVSQDEALVESITLLSAGVGEQFDTLKIWYFDAGVESWTGNGSPAASDGWLRPADDASDPYVVSPTGIAAPGGTYGQVRARVRKYGSPTWEGYLWWREAADSTWDAGRRVSITEPTYDSNGVGLLTVTPEWVGTIDRIRVDLSDAADGTDYYTIDWIAVGRPSPGASVASLLAEQTTRAAADSALALSLTALDARVGTAEADIVSEASTRATAVSAEATLREALAVQLRGSYTGTDIASVSAGLIYSERQTRVTEDGVLAASIDALTATVGTVSAAVTSEATARASEDAALAGSITAVSATANSKAKVFIQTSAPSSGMSTNDVWFDSDDGNKPYTYNGSAWVDRTDSRTTANAAAITAETTARVNGDASLASSITTVTATANSKAKVFVQTAAPSSGMSANDVWFDSDDGNKPYTYSGSAWVDRTDSRLTSNAAAITAEATARANADSAEVTARQALATKVTGLADPSGATLATLATGLIYDERQARTTADAAITTVTTSLQSQVNTANAAITTEASTRATADTAAATRIDGLFATNGAFDSYSNDPTHQNWPSANALPTNVTTSGTAPTTTRVTSGQVFGEKALRGAGTATATTGYLRAAASMKPASAPAGGYVVCEWVATLVSGDFRRAGFEYRLNYTSGYKRASVHLFDQHASPTTGKTYRGSKLVALTDVSSSGSVVDQTDYLWLNNSTLFTTQANAAKTITFERVAWREATAEEIAAGVTLPTVQAALTAEETARITADAAEVTARQALSAKLTGLNDPSAATLASLSGGLLYEERQARVSAVDAVVSSVTALSATVSGHTTSITTNATAVATLSGQVYGSYGVTVNADGNIAGLTLYAGGGATPVNGVKIEADEFLIRSGTETAITPFTYDAVLGKLVLNSVVANEVTTNALNGDEIKVSGQIKVGSGDDTLILSGAHASKRAWAGNSLPENAPFTLGADGEVILKKFKLIDESGQLLLSQAGQTDAFRLSGIASQQNAAPTAASVFGAVVHQASAVSVPTNGKMLGRLGDQSTVSVKVDWNVQPAVGASGSDFPSSVTLNVYERYSSDGVTWGSWSSIGSQAFSKITSGSPSSTQFRVASKTQVYKEFDIGAGDVVETTENYAIIDTPSALTFTVAGLSRAAGYYEYCVTGGNSAPFTGCTSLITLTDTDSTPSWFVNSVASTGAVPYQKSTGDFKRLRLTRPTTTSVAVSAAYVVMTTPSGLIRTVENFSATLDLSGAVTAPGLNRQDTGSLPVGATWLWVWAVSNGVTDGAVVSTSDTAPSLSGYNYRALIGVVRWAGSSVRNFIQRGNVWTYIATGSSIYDMVSGDQGDHDATGDSATWVQVDTDGFVPTNGLAVDIIMQVQANSGTGIIAPNNTYGGFDSANNRPPFVYQTGGAGFASEVRMALESQYIYYAVSHSSWKVICRGFTLDI